MPPPPERLYFALEFRVAARSVPTTTFLPRLHSPLSGTKHHVDLLSRLRMTSPPRRRIPSHFRLKPQSAFRSAASKTREYRGHAMPRMSFAVERVTSAAKEVDAAA